MKTYKINEIFYSLQGEGVRAGTANVFIRFSDCNLRCSRNKEGFDCDTEFISGTQMNLDQILSQARSLSATCDWVILTGGEPSLQIDDSLLDALHTAGYKIAIESNGLRELSSKIDWICISPKTAESSLRQKTAHELKYVRALGMKIPNPSIKAEHYLISPAFEVDHLPSENLEHCLNLIRDNPKWRLSVQQHKIWKVR
ncbi:MAG: hypothetical protein COV44_10105 [Deltaproteobacteria bacterium CG11_big_fil_rev_8_21_14_0_20_45_16]|nr:MAG: hypothetical protein COV44_10105 [Deltaproteobacteria bacterium CG11_big_fil_rev_8_21_14_0_20_45_16]